MAFLMHERKEKNDEVSIKYTETREGRENEAADHRGKAQSGALCHGGNREQLIQKNGRVLRKRPLCCQLRLRPSIQA